MIWKLYTCNRLQDTKKGVGIICKILVKTELFFVYNVTAFKIGCRFNKLENINKSYLKILKQQI